MVVDHIGHDHIGHSNIGHRQWPYRPHAMYTWSAEKYMISRVGLPVGHLFITTLLVRCEQCDYVSRAVVKVQNSRWGNGTFRLGP